MDDEYEVAVPDQQEQDDRNVYSEAFELSLAFGFQLLTTAMPPVGLYGRAE